MPHLPNPNPVRPGPGPQQRLRNLQRRFRAVSARHDRAVKLRRVIRAAAVVVAFATAFAVAWGLGSSPWPVTTTLKHIASAPNCDFARLVGLAPAKRGEPGYWKRHDRDGDGVACEPWPPRRGAASRPFSLTTAMANSDRVRWA
ncbi:excalibur calcium-binding domain-containing protein [Bradyrhizobium sp. 170]|uniref:excalibur calcium-binding domain-containing protein n=1 Tax=Bradyrhizobium sp. 170 TaxID=2782641 RepID=UPI001FFFA0F9|nr:excalibur calcium-binding domain-containing protein [Bradyrhizobium sp. 170]UPK03422.1 excalibur calcium-binding domain-containing protein [Bradyrhizobium sp. 170]